VCAHERRLLHAVMRVAHPLPPLRRGRLGRMSLDVGPSSKQRRPLFAGEYLRVLGVLEGTRSTASDLFRSWVQADFVSDLVDATPGACTQFVQSLGLPELKAKRLLAALGGAAQGEVPPAIVAVACKHTRTHVNPSCAFMGFAGAPPSRQHVASCASTH
jgi:hypothetical protein